jgi:tripartite-type tricarboxylate transporter receptor subunit TctC
MHGRAAFVRNVPGYPMTTARPFRHFPRAIASLIALLAMAAAISLLHSGATLAQAWPAKPIHYVVAYAPGGTSDIVARAITPGLSQFLGQSIVVENKPGGNGVIATDLVAKSPPDGYTLLHTSVSFFTVTPLLSSVSYDWQKDFEPVGMIGTNVNVLVVNPSLPVTDFKAFIDYAKANPGKLNYGTSGSGTGAHILIEYLKTKVGFKAEHIPYKGAAPALNDLLGGRTQFGFDPAVTPQVQAGKLRALAISGASSLDLLPGVPPIEKFVPEWNPPQFYNFISAPAGTPREVQEKIAAALKQVLADPKVQKALRDNNYEPGFAGPAKLKTRLRADYAATGDVLKQNNIKLD